MEQATSLRPPSAMDDEYETRRQRFALYILPYLRQVEYSAQHERAQELTRFWEAAFVVMADRFPVTGDPMDGYRAKCTKQRLKAHATMYLTLPRYSGRLPSTEDWRTFLTIESDRARRRQWWSKHGSGPPVEHQFIVAFQHP
ncbi:hypothetical protein ONZ45_g7024 [Pleurotus djamor]|nr:hypothetical protein ONZ45_g7024 [Pleurotus djamor]